MGEHLQQAIGAVVDGESLRVVARCRGAAQCRGAWVGQLVKRGGEPGDVVDTDRRAARRLGSPPAVETIGVTPSCIDSTCTPLWEARR